MEHYEAYVRAIQEGKPLPMRYFKLILFGPPRSGKSTTLRRLFTSLKHVVSQMKYKEVLGTPDNQLFHLAFLCNCNQEPHGHLMKMFENELSCRCHVYNYRSDMEDDHVAWLGKVS